MYSKLVIREDLSTNKRPLIRIKRKLWITYVSNSDTDITDSLERDEEL
jgi:hypothetical protein